MSSALAGETNALQSVQPDADAGSRRLIARDKAAPAETADHGSDLTAWFYRVSIRNGIYALNRLQC